MRAQNRYGTERNGDENRKSTDMEQTYDHHGRKDRSCTEAMVAHGKAEHRGGKIMRIETNNGEAKQCDNHKHMECTSTGRVRIQW